MMYESRASFRTVDPNLHPLTRLLRWAAIFAAVLWLLCFVYIAVDLLQGHGFPLARKFFPFEDITIYQPRFRLFHTAAFFQPPVHSRRLPWGPAAFAYPPTAALVYAAFYLFDAPEIPYLLLTALWTVLIIVATWRLLSRFLPTRRLAARYLCCLAFFSFPLVFLAERGNIELLVWIVLTCAVWLCLRGHSLAAAALIGAAGAVKLYPIFLLGLFVTRARIGWRAIAAGLCCASLVTLMAVWYAGPTYSVALYGFIDGVSKFNQQHAEAARHSEAVFDHSLFSPVKLAYLGAHDTPLQWSTVYFVCAGLAALAAFWFRVRELPFLNRLAFLSVAMILLPPVSYEYTIIHVYLTLLLLLITAITQLRASTGVHPSVIYAICCLLCAMLPLGLLQGGTFLYAGEIQLAALLLFAFYTMRTAWVLPLTPRSVEFP